jgi:hypothetical protein
MLVCHVVQQARRAAIAADVAELAAAVDAPGTGNVVFATLVDDPASVREFVDAYLGQIMVEAASAAAIVNAGLVYAVSVDEAGHAVELLAGSLPSILSAAIVEAASATDLVDNSVTAGAPFNGIVALDGPIMPSIPQPTVIYIEG